MIERSKVRLEIGPADHPAHTAERRLIVLTRLAAVVLFLEVGASCYGPLILGILFIGPAAV